MLKEGQKKRQTVHDLFEFAPCIFGGFLRVNQELLCDTHGWFNANVIHQVDYKYHMVYHMQGNMTS